MCKYSILTILLALVSFAANANKYHGRITLGSLVSQETFKEKSAETSNNDFNILSTRFYLDVSEIGGSRFAFITDLRDKHDFFHKLDREKLELSGENDLQVRQLYLKYPNLNGNYFFNLGRFSPIEAGAIYLDGLQLGLRLAESFSVSVLGGGNPKKESKSSLEQDPKAQNQGFTSLFFAKTRKSGGYYYLANSVIIQTYDGEEDRKFWFHNSIFQFNRTNRFTALFYRDYVPTEKFQNLWVNYWFKLKRTFSVSLSSSKVDVIEYSRKQDIRETLEPSVYEQNKIKLRIKSSNRITTEVKYLSGARKKDKLTKVDGQLGFIFHRFLSKNLNAHLYLGQRDNFTSDDTLARLGINSYSDTWEYSLEQELISEEEKTGEKNFVKITEFVISRLFSRTFFTTFSLQYAQDDKVDIVSTFFKLTYRFGNREVPPIRDGAPAQGKL